ncbi:PEGA domain-containing protein [bacterium]|nr:PEGA domain-containing protein [candidate division CSSED10-310 bacterium]
MKYTVFDKFAVLSSILLVISICPLTDVCAQIQEENLPQTKTFREMSLRLDVLESAVKDSELDVSIEQLLSIRQHCENLMPRLSPADRQEAQSLIHRTLLLQAILLYYGGDPVMAESYADELLRKEPSVSLAGNLATPEVAEWFEAIREKHTGFVTILSDPVGSTVIMDGTEFGVTPMDNAFAPVGEHDFEVVHNGFDSFRQRVLIVHQETRVINAQLKRNTGGLFIWVSPAGTSVSISTLPRSIQTQPVTPWKYLLLQTMGFDPFNFSEPIYIPLIPAGESTIRLEKACRQPITYTFTLEPADYFIPLVVLPKSETRTSVDSIPSDQNVFIDGEWYGKTPLTDIVICPGERTIRVEFSDGTKWQETTILKADDTSEFLAEPRPSVLFLGSVSSDKGLSIEGEISLAEWLTSTNKLNVIRGTVAHRYRMRPVVASVIESLASPSFNPHDPNWLAKVENMVASLSDTDTSVIAFAKLEPANSPFHSQMFFIHRDSSKPDILSIAPGLPTIASLKPLNSYISDIPPLTRLRSGLRVTNIGQDVVISQIIIGGPAETSPLQIGDVIVSVNNIPLISDRDFNRILEDPDSPQTMPLVAVRGERRIVTSIDMKRQPMVTALEHSGIMYNLLLAYLEIELGKSETPADPLLIQAGVFCLAIGRPDRAREYFNSCQLTDIDGFGKGSLAYLKYLAEGALQNHSAASLNLKTAMESAEATIIHGDGPLLSDLLQ